MSVFPDSRSGGSDSYGGAPGGQPKTLTRRLPRALPLKERFTMVDTVPKATRTPPRVPIRARASECLLLLSRSRENGLLHVCLKCDVLRYVRCL